MKQEISTNRVITSSAYPCGIQPPLESPSHQILAKSTAVDTNIKIRILQSTDVHQIKKLNIQFFPLRYQDSYYLKIINNEVYGYVAQVQVQIIGTTLLQILNREQHKHLKQQQQDKKQRKRSISNMDNKYYTKQNLRLNSRQSIKCRVLIGSILFSMRDSQGYLYRPWWKQLLITDDNCLYISTIGVIQQFRGKKIAQRLLDAITNLTQNNKQIKFVFLHVIEYNKAAIQLYKKIGFQQLQVISDFYHIQKKPYLGVALGKFINGGKKKQSWGEWLSKLWA